MILPLLLILALASFSEAVIPALPTGWSYVGCLHEGNDREHLLSANYEMRADMTIRVCVDICSNRGNTYAGLQNSNQCTCGNALAFVESASEDSCDTPCNGAPDQPCGGHVTYMNVLHYIPPPPPPSTTPRPTTTQPVAPGAAPPSSTTRQPNTLPPSAEGIPASSAPPPLVSASSTTFSTILSIAAGSTIPLSGTASLSASGGPAKASSSVSSTGVSPIQITQYLLPSTTSANPSQFSGSALIAGAQSSVASDRLANITIVRLTPGQTYIPKLRDQADQIVFGTYFVSAARTRLDMWGCGAGFVSVVWLVLWLGV